MSLKGNLQSVDLANVFQMLSINQKEGTLVLFDGDTKKSIYFSKEGVSMLSRGRRGTDSLGRILLRYGKITPEQLTSALEKQRTEGKRIGQALEELGAVTAEDIANAVRTQNEEEIYSLFIWKEASFEFVEGPPPESTEQVPTQVTFNVNSLIMEAQRRADEWNYIRGLVPSLDEVYRPTAKMPEAVVDDEVFHMPFAPKLLEVLQQGRLSAGEIMEASYAGKFEVCKILAILLEQGAIEPLSIQDLTNLAQESTAAGDHKSSAKYLRRVVDLGGATPNVNLSLGYALEALDERERAAFFLKTAADAYLDTGQSGPAFDAYQRVARLLPTDIPAVTRLVEIACDNAEILAANRHEVVETGRVLAQVLKEVGRILAAVQVLQRLTTASPQDLTLRNMLVAAYQESEMIPEAVAELESIAAHCASRQNYEEAIRYYRRVLALDRTRESALKKIASLTKERDRKKRLLVRGGVAFLVLAVVGSLGYMVYKIAYGIEADQRLFDKDIKERMTEAMGPVTPLLDRLERLAHDLEVRGPEITKKELDEAKEDLLKKIPDLETKIGLAKAKLDELPKKYPGMGVNVDERKQQLDEKLATVKRQRDEFYQSLRQKGRELATQGEGLRDTRPSKAMEAYRRAQDLVDGVPGAEAQRVECAKWIEGIAHYEELFGNATAEALRLERDGDVKQAHALLVDFLSQYAVTVEFEERLRFPFRLTTRPPNAAVEVLTGIAAEAPGGVLHYEALKGIKARVSAPGFAPVERVLVEPISQDPTPEAIRTLAWEAEVRLEKVPLWTAPALYGSPVETPPLSAGSRILVVDRAGHILALDPQDGRVAVFDALSPGGSPGPPASADGKAFFATADGVLAALDLPGLGLLWRAPAVGLPPAGEGVGPVSGGVLVAGPGLLVVASTTGLLSGLRPDGTPAWPALKLPSGVSRPILLHAPPGQAPRLVVPCDDGILRLVDPATGKLLLVVVPAPGSGQPLAPFRAAPLPLPGASKVLVQTERRFILVEIPAGGGGNPEAPQYKQRWVLEAPRGTEPAGAVVLGEDRILLLFSNGVGQVVRVQSDPSPGKDEVALLKPGEKPSGPPATDGKLVFVASEGVKGKSGQFEGARLLALEPRREGGFDLVWHWKAPPGTRLITGPSVAGKLVLVASSDGTVFALVRE